MVKEIKGCAFICRHNGVIIEILRDDFGIKIEKGAITRFENLIDHESRIKYRNMIAETRKNKVAFDYRLKLSDSLHHEELYFMGFCLENQMLIIGADNHKEAIKFADYLLEINNEQSNLIRSLIQKNAKLEKQANDESEATFNEITAINNQLVNLQRELNKKNSDLASLNDLKNRFMSIASHDLRNPLNVIQMYSEFLLNEMNEFGIIREKKYLEIIYNSAKYMTALVDDLLEYTKIESGAIELNKQNFNFVKMVKNIIQYMEPIAQRKEIKISAEGIESNIEINADYYKIEQVLNNLLGNAIKFSFPNTCILIKIKDEHDNIFLSVNNTGIVIEEKNYELIFRPFRKLVNLGTAKEKGSGLGLFVTKNIIENHNGKIWVESNKDNCTTFFVNLPK